MIDPTDALVQVERLLYGLPQKFHRSFGGDPDELLSEAQWKFLEACQTWEEGRGTRFSTWVHTCVWRHLIDVTRRNAARHSRHEERNVDVPTPRSTLNDLSDQAWDVLLVLLDMPQWAVEVRRKRRRGTRSIDSLRRRVRDALVERGWTAGEIDHTFNEIAEVLR